MSSAKLKIWIASPVKHRAIAFGMDEIGLTDQTRIQVVQTVEALRGNRRDELETLWVDVTGFLGTTIGGQLRDHVQALGFIPRPWSLLRTAADLCRCCGEPQITGQPMMGVKRIHWACYEKYFDMPKEIDTAEALRKLDGHIEKLQELRRKSGGV